MRSWKQCVQSMAFVVIGLTATAAYAAEIELGAATAKQGDTATIKVSIAQENTPANYAGLNARLELPEGVELLNMVKSTTGPLEKFTIDFYNADALHDRTAGIIAYSGDSSVLFTSEKNAELLELTLQVHDNAKPGVYPITITSSGLSNSDGSKSVPHTPLNGTLTIAEPALGTEVFTIRKAQEGKGKGTIVYENQECGPSCEEMVIPYKAFKIAKLVVNPVNGSTFRGWSDSDFNPIGDKIIHAKAGETVYATFDKQ